MNQSEQNESSIGPEEMAAAQVDADPEMRRMEGERQTSPERQMISRGAGSGQADCGISSVEAEASEKTSKMKPQLPGEQTEGRSGSDTTTGGR